MSTSTRTVDADGNVFWEDAGKLHRLGGPAVETVNGYRAWWVNGQQHRIDGPAVEGATGARFWWVNGQQCTSDEHSAWRALDPDAREVASTFIRDGADVASAVSMAELIVQAEPVQRLEARRSTDELTLSM